jgi:hypothetical protein
VRVFSIGTGSSANAGSIEHLVTSRISGSDRERRPIGFTLSRRW